MGIQISGLLSGSAFDWKSVVDQLIAADSIPITTLQNQQANNSAQVTALSDITTALQGLQDSVQDIRANNPFQDRAVSSDNASTSWRATSSAGAAIGSYKFNVTQLATQANLSGTTDIGQGLSNSTDVSGVTISSMNTAVAVTAGTFTVDGHQISVTSTDSLQSVFDMISTATSGAVTASYNASSDAVSLTDGGGNPILLGAANDTSNFLQVLKLANNGSATVSSSASLGVAKLTATIANAGLRTPITAVDGSGNGTFTVNGVSIAYNVNTDTLGAVLNRISGSTAGVLAVFDPTSDSIKLTNKSTGDVGISVSESAGGLLGALGLTGGTFNRGKNAEYYLNDGATKLTSTTNTLSASSHGITGLSVTVNTLGTETLTVASDTTSMQQHIQTFLDKFNAVQDLIDQDTAISTDGGTVKTSVLSGNHEVEDWASQLRSMAFGTISGLTGSVSHLDDLGIDFDGTSGHLLIKDSGKLTDKLTNHPDDVQEFFLNGSTNMVGQMYDRLTDLKSADSDQRNNLQQANKAIDDQIATLQTRLANERETLTNAFIQMLDAQSSAQSQNQSLTQAFFKNSSG